MDFIEERDGGIKSDPDTIYMTNGASNGIQMMLTALIKDSSWCVFILLTIFIFLFILQYFVFVHIVVS